MSANKSFNIKKGSATFLHNGSPVILRGGAIHYFRIPREYWKDRIEKLKAMGLNAVDTYVPWNLHERLEGQFDFGNLSDAMSPFLDLVQFVKLIKDAGLFLTLRPGPYICAEMDFGGMPSWLLRKAGINVRTSDPKFLGPAKTYLKQVLSLVSQYSIGNGGPMIAVQVENEYGAFGYEDLPRDTHYLQELHSTMKLFFPLDDVLFFTCDSPSQHHDLGSIPGVYQMVNTQTNIEEEIALLKEQGMGPYPAMVMEFWTGWFDHWLEEHHNVWDDDEFTKNLQILEKNKHSFSMYMFIGGTNFGFMAGANIDKKWPFYAPTITSYDYDCMLTENGDPSNKYDLARNELVRKELSAVFPAHIKIPTSGYNAVKMTKILNLDAILAQVPAIESKRVLAMEELPINNNNGQSFGYVVYRKKISVDSATLKVKGHIRDLLVASLDGDQISESIMKPEDLNRFGSWVVRDSQLRVTGNSRPQTLDLLVENCGRVNYGKPHSYRTKKGLSEGPVFLDQEELQDWQIFPLEMKMDWIQSLTGFSDYENGGIRGPAILAGNLQIDTEPKDTFVDATSWLKGAVFVNGFNLGRFWVAGPQKTLFLPAPLLRKGKNTITLFVQYKCQGNAVEFLRQPLLGKNNPTGATPGSGGQLLDIKPY